MSLLGIGASDFNLNSDLISKLKNEETARINSSLLSNINTLKESDNAMNAFKAQIRALESLFNTETTNYEANIDGVPVGLEMISKEISALSFNIDVSSLAKRDVYQSEIISGDFNSSIEIRGEKVSASSYEELKDKLNEMEGVYVSIDRVSDNSFRLIVKSDTGEDNALGIVGLEKIQSASNLKLNIDGVDHSYSNSSFEYQGLKLSIHKEGESKISVKEDLTEINQKNESFFEAYNSLLRTIKSSDFKGDKRFLEESFNKMKSVIFSEDFFNKGLKLNDNAELSGELDKESSEKLYEKMKDVLRDINLNSFDNSSRILALEETLNQNLKMLDLKYKGLGQQFIAYNSMINSMSAGFSSLKLLIEQSTKS